MLIKYDECVSADFTSQVLQAIESVPVIVIQRLNEAGVELRIGKLLTDMIPDLKGTPPGWPAGSTWKNLSGIYHSSRDGSVIIGISEYYEIDGRVVKSKKVAAVVRHEVGHAWDVAAVPAGERSRSSSFVDAYKEDILRMGPLDRIHLGYFLNSGHDGLKEVFAEAFAWLTGGSSLPGDHARLFREAFRNSIGVVANMLNLEFTR